MNKNTTKVTNRIQVVGTVVSALEFSHEVVGEKFYSFHISTNRLSVNADTINVTISERLLIGQEFHIRTRVTVTGQVRTYNKTEHNRSSLIITLFATDYANCEEITKDNDEVELTGFVCKAPIYRTTPLGREITDVVLAVNRSYNKSDYIPVVVWGRNARFCKSLQVGDSINIKGRLQSREYQKKNIDGSITARIAYEISVSNVIKEEGDA